MLSFRKAGAKAQRRKFCNSIDTVRPLLDVLPFEEIVLGEGMRLDGMCSGRLMGV